MGPLICTSRIGLQVAGAVLAPILALLATSPARAESRCADVYVPVSLAAKGPKNQKIYGQLCLPSRSSARTLQILVHGQTYDHRYWNFPGFGGHYSYVRAMNEAGRATLSIDQLGVGRSSHPASALVTPYAAANALHDVVTAARFGRFGPKPSKVVLVGHSAGSLTSWVEAAIFQDVDGILATGVSHSSGTPYLARITALARPALLDPVTAPRIPKGDLGYISAPGARAKLFYYLPNAANGVIDNDESSRSEFPFGGTAPGLFMPPSTKGIKVPVLIVNGAFDMPFCKQGGAGSLTDCSSDAALRASEAPYFVPSARLEAVVVPKAGHSINLHYNGAYFFNSALSWLARHFPL